MYFGWHCIVAVSILGIDEIRKIDKVMKLNFLYSLFCILKTCTCRIFTFNNKKRRLIPYFACSLIYSRCYRHLSAISQSYKCGLFALNDVAVNCSSLTEEFNQFYKFLKYEEFFSWRISVVMVSEVRKN